MSSRPRHTRRPAPAQDRPTPPTRADLLAAVGHASQENSHTAVLLHSLMSERLGLHPSEEKTLALLEPGPLTAGEIAARTGLAAASVTSLIDRLERKGLARRVRDPVDRRKVRVELDPAGTAGFGASFEPLKALLEELLTPYSGEQLETILHFLKRATSLTRAEIARLEANPPRTASPGGRPQKHPGTVPD